MSRRSVTMTRCRATMTSRGATVPSRSVRVQRVIVEIADEKRTIQARRATLQNGIVTLRRCSVTLQGRRGTLLALTHTLLTLTRTLPTPTRTLRRNRDTFWHLREMMRKVSCMLPRNTPTMRSCCASRRDRAAKLRGPRVALRRSRDYFRRTNRAVLDAASPRSPTTIASAFNAHARRCSSSSQS